MPENETECLHCEINEVVRRHIEQEDPVNLPDLSQKLAKASSTLSCWDLKISGAICWPKPSATSGRHTLKKPVRSKARRPIRLT